MLRRGGGLRRGASSCSATSWKFEVVEVAFLGCRARHALDRLGFDRIGTAGLVLGPLVLAVAAIGFDAATAADEDAMRTRTPSRRDRRYHVRRGVSITNSDKSLRQLLRPAGSAAAAEPDPRRDREGAAAAAAARPCKCRRASPMGSGVSRTEQAIDTHGRTRQRGPITPVLARR